MLFLIVSVSFLFGCGAPAASEPSFCRVVTEIDIVYKNSVQRRYSDPTKLVKTLNYFRNLELWDHLPHDPFQSGDSLYHVTLHFSDGSVKTYDQVSSHYLRINGGPWFEIPSEHGIRLALLLAAIPGDT